MPFTHEVETQFQKGQLGIEAEYGTAVAASLALGSVSITPAIKRQEKKYAARGFLLPTVHRIGREHTELSFEGEATYEEIGYFIKDVVSDAQVDPIDEQLIYTVETGGLVIPGCVVTGWTLKGNRDEVTLNGSIKGKKGVVQAPTAGLTALTQTPIDAAGVVITIDGSPLAKVFEWEASVSDLWDGATFVGSSTFANVLQKMIDGKFSCKMECDATGLAMLEEDSVVPVTIVCTTGANIFGLAFDAKVGEPNAFEDQDGIYAVQHNLTIMNKDTKAITVTNV